MAASLGRTRLVTTDSSSTVGSMVSQSPALSPGHSDAGSGSGTPNSSPPASRPRSPELKHNNAGHDADLEPLEPMTVKNVCFVGAGFVGKSLLYPALGAVRCAATYTCCDVVEFSVEGPIDLVLFRLS